jgi:hypothetical protein
VTDTTLLLTGLASAGLLAVGGLALVAPSRLSKSYGVPVDDRNALAYVRATGARDFALGGIFAANVCLQDSRSLLILSVAGVALALSDFAIAYTWARRFQSEHLAHLGGAFGFAVISALLARSI